MSTFTLTEEEKSTAATFIGALVLEVLERQGSYGLDVKICERQWEPNTVTFRIGRRDEMGGQPLWLERVVDLIPVSGLCIDPLHIGASCAKEMLRMIAGKIQEEG